MRIKIQLNFFLINLIPFHGLYAVLPEMEKQGIDNDFPLRYFSKHLLRLNVSFEKKILAISKIRSRNTAIILLKLIPR